MKQAFTLIELLVVMGIAVVLIAVAAPSLKALSKGNGAASSANLIRAYLSNARAVAISQHRQAGVVFFEETAAKAGDMAHTNQTAMQILVEDPNQFQYTPIASNTVFIAFSHDRPYLPNGIMVTTLNDNASTTTITGQNGSGTKSRVVLFDAEGQMVLRNGISRPNLSGSAGQYPQMYSDWNVTTAGTTPSNGVSAPGLLIYNKADYNTELPNFGAGAVGDKNRSIWLQANAQIIIVNAYTGGVIR